MTKKLAVEAIRRPRSVLRDFLRSEAAGGILLMAAAAVALGMANSPLADAYFHNLHRYLGPLSVSHWINDGLMTLFFLLVGLEIKRELVDGQLARWSDRVLPTIAAGAGMAVPALIYLSVTASEPSLHRGWAIPTATDIAFAIGVMAMLGDRVPASLKLLLTTIAIVDDMGAVAVIALAYTDTIDAMALGAAGAILAAMFLLNRKGVQRLAPYMVLAALLWLAVLLSGIHATVAGVLAAVFVPIRATPGTPESTESPLHRLEHGLHRWVAYGVVPLFGFANAGVSLRGIGIDQVLAPLPMGVAGGLFLGKQAAVFLALRISAWLGLGCRPAGAGWLQTYGMCLLCGIGFTMSLFVGGLAFDDPAHIDQVKIGVLGGSLVSALTGFLLLRFAPRR
ncbi:Na+/H+ antiporter NhaA [Novosphingobium kaempferiae]|uniref:Na+/H+ antiporter NhaA n=1 Tax=Novosphingobium kaempferiae TaxID=2896849 RepID=UPI001E62006A|nr:Na+/H+ antiporter NhaA [Novosphingobium kaempferiae]